MKEYEAIREIINQCPMNHSRDQFFEEIECEDPEVYIKNALSPSDVIWVQAYTEEQDGKQKKCAKVVVPDDQLSLAIGKEGQNASLAAKLTGYKIDIKSESQAKELGMIIDDYDDYADDYEDEE